MWRRVILLPLVIAINNNSVIFLSSLLLIILLSFLNHPHRPSIIVDSLSCVGHSIDHHAEAVMIYLRITIGERKNHDWKSMMVVLVWINGADDFWFSDRRKEKEIGSRACKIPSFAVITWWWCYTDSCSFSLALALPDFFWWPQISWDWAWWWFG